MLSLSKPLSPERAAWYFERDNYYLTQEGEWYGKVAAGLNLSGPIKRGDFLKLLEGYDQYGNKLVASAGAKDIKDEKGNIKRRGHRSGIDLTFSAPKSVSILSYRDSRINDAFKIALRTTLDHVEKEFAYTQTKERSGFVRAEKTNSLLWSTFVHDTSRELDPQLHCHCVLLNLTQNTSGKFKTTLNDSIYKNKLYIGQHFRSQLARELQNIGYEIEVSDRSKGFFEIKGIGDELINAFSLRSKQVREEMNRLRGLEFKDLPGSRLIEWAKERKKEFVNSPDFEKIVNVELNKLSKSTEKVYSSFGDAELASIAVTNRRRPKRHDVSREQVIAHIESTCNCLNTSLEKLYTSTTNQTRSIDIASSARDILNDVVKGLTEVQSTFSLHTLMNEAMKMGIGNYTHSDFYLEFNKMLSEESVSLLGAIETKSGKRDVYSSKEMIDVENSIIDMCRKCKGLSEINVAKSITDSFISHTDINLKMKSALQLNEKDPVKADFRFKSLLSEISNQSVKNKLIKIRDRELQRISGSDIDPADAIHFPELHEYFEKFGYGFTSGQKDALRLIASTRDVFSVIQGDAGTGKSFSCLYGKQLLEQHGYKVRGFAPTGKAATGLAGAAEIEEGRFSTIDSFLLQFKNSDSERRQAMFDKGREVWIVDEAGMCGSRKYLELMSVAREAEAKVVFIGDRKQFQSIEAGRMFSELQDKSGIDMVIMPDVMRQKTSQTKEIVKAISLKEMDFAFNIMQGYKQVSESFNKKDVTNYSIGSSIQFTTGYKGIPSDTYCKVKKVSSESLSLEYFDDESRSFKQLDFNPSQVDEKAFDLYQPPHNHNKLSNFNLEDELNLSIPEQGLPATKLKVVEVRETNLLVSYKDPLSGEARKASFDPTQNPGNFSHFTSSGNQKLEFKKDYYENMISVESDKDKCLNLVAKDYLDSISHEVGQKVIIADDCGKIPMGTKAEILKINDKSYTVRYNDPADNDNKEAEIDIKAIAPGKQVLLITGTNKDKETLNDIIRPELVKKGLITDSKEYCVFQSKSLAGTAAMVADSYKAGQVIITNKKSGSVPKGTQAEILKINIAANTISVRFWDKASKSYTVSDIDVRKNCKNFSTYDQKVKEFGVGEFIIFLKNDKRVVGVNNGDTARILSIDDEGNVRARIESSDDKKEVTFNINNRGPKAYNFVSSAYAITDYKSQGATTDRLLWYAPTESARMSSNTFYVAITRCKNEVGVYTDDVEKLKEMVKEEQHKESVLDYGSRIKKNSFDNANAADPSAQEKTEISYRSPFSFKSSIHAMKELYTCHIANIFSPREPEQKDKSIEVNKQSLEV
jgi:conjugative relaxase-like TrwC/TraI family protein